MLEIKSSLKVQCQLKKPLKRVLAQNSTTLQEILYNTWDTAQIFLKVAYNHEMLFFNSAIRAMLSKMARKCIKFSSKVH